MSDNNVIIEVFNITFSFIRDHWVFFLIPFTFFILSSFIKVIKYYCMPSGSLILESSSSFHCDSFDNDVEISYCETYCPFYKNGCSRFRCDSKE